MKEIRISKRERYYTLLINELINEFVSTPKYQRLLDKKHVEKIYNSIITILDEGKDPYLPGCIEIVKYNDKKWLVDGNHRFHAYKKLYEDKGINFMIMCNEIEVDDEKEAETVFNIINKNVPIPKMPDSINLSCINGIVKHFFEKYPKVFSNSKSGKCYKPNLHRQVFQEKIGSLIKMLKDKNITFNDDLIINKIENFNSMIGRKGASYFVKNDEILMFKPLMTKAKEKGDFYVGLFDNYKWLFDLFNVSENDIMEVVTEKKKRQNIPKALRIAVWNRYMGENTRKAKCLLCSTSEISIENFHCSHDIADANGGELNVDNLLPLCSVCNLSMGTRSFEEIKKHFY